MGHVPKRIGNHFHVLNATARESTPSAGCARGADPAELAGDSPLLLG